MSAKLVSDENPNLNKQFGCMNGIFQVFYRQHSPARPVTVSSDVDKFLPSGERRDIVVEPNMESDKDTEMSNTKKKKKSSAAKEKHRISSETSSRLSFSSTPRSSSFSSTEVSTTASQYDLPAENLIREQQPNGPYDLKELVKGSINREMKTNSEQAAFIQQQSPNSARTSMLLLKESSLHPPCRSSNEQSEGRRIAVKVKESHRLSYDEREMRNNNGYKTGTNLKETARLSLDSRSSSVRSARADAARLSCPEGPVTINHRRSSSSVVAKLMGLEVIAGSSDTEKRRENLFIDSPRPVSRVEPTTLQRSRSVDSIKKIPSLAASKVPMEQAPWKQMKARDAATVYGEIQKWLTQLEFKNSGKDLRALKQILEAMEKTTPQLIDESRDDSTLGTTFMQRTHQPVPPATSPARNFRSSSNVVAAPVSTSSLPQIVALPNVKVGNSRQTREVTSGKQNAMDLTPRPRINKGQLDSTKSNSPKTSPSRQALTEDSCSLTKSGRSQQPSVSPRAQPKKLVFEKQSPPKTPKSDPGKKQPRRQQTEVASSRRKQGIKPLSSLQQPAERLSNTSSNLRSLRSGSNVSLGSNVDIEVTSRHKLERNCDFSEQHTPKQRSPDFGIKQDRPSLKTLKVTVEQPSPVSVLDAAFEDDDSPSPVRKISLSFKEEDALRSDESEWINKPIGFCRSILFLESNRGPTQLGFDDLLQFPHEEGTDFKSSDNKYISDILLASGILRDLDYRMISFQLHQMRLPINPGLFFILEENISSNVKLPENKHRYRGFRQQQTNPTEKIRRKLIFDTVNEILAKRFSTEACSNPRLTKNPHKTVEKISNQEELLQAVCSEIDKFQQNNSKCILEDKEEDIIWEDLQIQGKNLKEFEEETPGIVLDIERMIFRDLVNEVCFH